MYLHLTLLEQAQAHTCKSPLKWYGKSRTINNTQRDTSDQIGGGFISV